MTAVTHALEGGIFTVTFANPPEGVFTGAMAEDLLALLPAMAADDVLAVILQGGVPGAFIRHYSVAELAALSDALRAKGRTFDETTPVDHHAMNRIAEGLEALPKPAIAALNGTAMGGGWELAMACDLRIAEAGDHAYGLPEARLGILSGAGGTQRLARLVREARALEMTLRGRTVGPEEALALGMVHEVAPDAAARAAKIARELAARPAKALAHIKRLVRAALPPIDPDTLQLESRLFLDLAVSDDGNALMRRMVDEGLDIREVE
ncbi:MAG: enoyl-CoA hydratase-related protein [Rhodospirillaceae bacterium]|nr:enoyl-CoA hydratase-related protein [Rhodospirillaceae bacterium]